MQPAAGLIHDTVYITSRVTYHLPLTDLPTYLVTYLKLEYMMVSKLPTYQIVVTDHLPVAVEMVGAGADMLHAVQADAGSSHGFSASAQPVIQRWCPAPYGKTWAMLHFSRPLLSAASTVLLATSLSVTRTLPCTNSRARNLLDQVVCATALHHNAKMMCGWTN